MTSTLNSTPSHTLTTTQIPESLLSEVFPQFIHSHIKTFTSFIEKQSPKHIRAVLEHIFQKIRKLNEARRQNHEKEVLLGGNASSLRKSKSEAFPDVSREIYDGLLVNDVLRGLQTVDYKHERDLLGTFMHIINSVDDFSAFYDLALNQQVPVSQIKFFYRMRREVLMEFFGVILTSFRKIALKEEKVEFRPFQCDSCQNVYCWESHIYKCTHCGNGTYCSISCREKDWTFHLMKCYKYTVQTVLKQKKSDQVTKNQEVKQQKLEAEKRHIARNKTYCNIFLFACAVFVSMLLLHWVIFSDGMGPEVAGRSKHHPTAVDVLLLTWKRRILQQLTMWRRRIQWG